MLPIVFQQSKLYEHFAKNGNKTSHQYQSLKGNDGTPETISERVREFDSKDIQGFVTVFIAQYIKLRDMMDSVSLPSRNPGNN